MGMSFFGALERNTAFTSKSIVSGPFSLPWGRTNANGKHLALITHINVHVAGRGGTVNFRTVVGNSSGNAALNFTVGPASTSTDRGWMGVEVPWLIDGGIADITLTGNGGTYYYGRQDSGSGIRPNEWTSGFLAGGVYYAEGPTPPRSLSASPSSTVEGRINLSWTSPADDGGTPINGYALYRNGAHYANIGVTNSFADNNTTPGSKYTYAVAASNLVTALGSTFSELSNSSAAVTSPGAPSAPRNLTATASPSTAGRINLAWAAPSSPRGTIVKYVIYRNGNFVAFSEGSGTTWSDYDQTVGTEYSYTVRARNSFSQANNSSGAASSADVARAPGTPSAPRNLRITASTSVFGRVGLSWDVPSVLYGAITRYNVYRDGTLVGSTTGTTYTDNDLTTAKSYSYAIRGRNAWGDAISKVGSATAAESIIAPGPPSAPRNLKITASETVAGRIYLEWDAPTTNYGAITEYRVFLSTGVLVGTSTPSARSLTITGLVPGATYRYYVRARNAIADIADESGPASDTVAITTLGAATAPSGLVLVPSTTVAGRLILTWTATPGANAYSVYWANGALITVIPTNRFVIDRLTPGTRYGFQVRARNVTSDAAGAEGGEYSAAIYGTAGDTTSQTVTPRQVTNATNSALSGTFILSPLTSATELKYAVTNSNLALTDIFPGRGTVSNGTNIALNGTYTVGAPTDTTLTFPHIGDDISVGTSTPLGTLTNHTNPIFNGTFTVIDADGYLKSVQYAKVNTNISSRHLSSGGTVTSKTNTVVNVSRAKIIDVTTDTVSYVVNHANLPLSAVNGTMTNLTNTEIFNGTFEIVSTPSFNTLTYKTLVSGGVAVKANILAPFGAALRTDSAAVLRVLYRSGWLG